MSTNKAKSVLLKILKGIGWFFLGLILLLIIIILSLRIPKVQQLITDEAVKFFKSKVNTEARIGRLYVNFPKTIIIENIYIEDLKGDTLVYSQRIAVDTDLWGLLDNRFEINDLEVEKLISNIYNTSNDSTFNYQFIIDGFAAPSDSTQTATSQDTTAQPFTFAIYEATIKDSRVEYKDLYNGMKLSAHIGGFHTSLSDFDLEELIISIDEITLTDSKGKFAILKSTESDTTAAEQVVNISGKSLLVDNVEFTFEDKPGALKVFTDIGRVEGDINEIDINRQIYRIDNMAILNSFVSVDQFSGADTTTTADTASTAAIELLASVKKGAIKNTSFRFYDHTAPAVQGFDPAHMWFRQVNADFEAIEFKNGYAQGEVKQLSANEKGGMTLKQFQSAFKYGPDESYANNLKLVTDRSNISADLRAGYLSIEALQNDLKAVAVDAKFSRSRIDLQDIFYFQPALKQNMPALTERSSQIIVEGAIEGELADLNVRQLELEALRSTHMQITGNIKGLPDADNLAWDVDLKELITSRRDISSVVPDTLIPPDINLPRQIRVSGTSKGSMSDFKARIKIGTSYGGAEANVRLTKQTPELYAYEGHIEADSFNLGALLNQEAQMGAISLNADVDGEGFDPADMKAKIKGKVSSFVYNSYNYNNLDINGRVEGMQFQGDLAMDDPNLDFDFQGLVNLNDSIPQYSFTLNLQALDMQALNFSQEDLKIRARVVSDIRGSTIQNINGTLEIEDMVISREEDIYRLDTFLLSATTDKEITDISIFSNIIDAQFNGNFDLATLPEVFEKHINRYYSLTDVPDVSELAPQQFDFNINIKSPLFFSEILIPGLEEFEPGPIKGSYNSDRWALDVTVNVPKIVYTGTAVDSLNIHVYSNEEYLGYETKIASLGAGAIEVENIHLTGIVEAGHIETDLMIKDDTGENKYMFGGIFISGDEYYRFQFTPGEFMLNYEDWKVKPSNAIDFYPSGIWVQNMVLTKDGQRIAVESAINQENDSTLAVGITDFDLSFIGKLDESEQYLVGGILDGNINLIMETAKSAFTSDLNITDFSFKGDTLGNVTLQAAQVEGNRYNLDLEIKSELNNLKVDGYYLADSVPDMHFDVDLVRLELASIESFTMGQLQNMDGFLTGDLQLRGSMSDPDIIGNIRFNEASFTTAFLGSRMSIDNEVITFNRAGITFNDFTIADVNNHTARINGRVLTKDYILYELDLNVVTNEFMLLNTTEDQNKLVYGKVEVNSRASIRGTSASPDIQLEVSLKDDSYLTYVIPEEEIQLQEREGVVEFFDKDQENDPFLQEKEVSATTDSLKSTFKGIDLTAKIDVNRSNTFSVIIDPVTGDKLTVQGDANLTLGIKPSGDMTLTGRYEVHNGQYNLNFYGLVKREFDIAEGSYLIWTGDPLNARVDITATYTVSAVYQNPGSNEVSSQKVPFIVYLDIKNELLSPEISFRLGLAESAAASGAQAFVSTVNKSENERNTQVFYLLLFKSTKDLESFSTTGGGGNIAEATARSSASRILSNQLNRLAGKIEGVELSLDLQSYNTTGASGGTTQLELGLSKQLFNNRVIVKVAGSFGLEGQEAEQQQNLSDFAGDIKVEYKITEDGRYRLVGFRQNEYDNLLQGEIIKTGVGIIFVRDYDAFRELFSMKKDKKEGGE
ncbi:hypothetical protein C900_05247 [Fulvivirga imtechensis AK7]|uniref:Translocation and assembly module TamB C-terminal domain-containing protein n=1 Tax=Fulvivirga imtechensis AK7 TaxID=1237149 RepID=L8JYF6_9BACT|nr:translocation/assembly module TamB domain-containing protein [Fulvivirga imtechensis]ELR73198.1 hypothetical protein C900_05247 [Fulvivirga imtechensis AK7]